MNLEMGSRKEELSTYIDALKKRHGDQSMKGSLEFKENVSGLNSSFTKLEGKITNSVIFREKLTKIENY